MTNGPLASSSGPFGMESCPEASVRGLHEAERSMDLRDDGGTFPNCGGDTLGRSGSDIADGKDIRQAGFQGQGLAGKAAKRIERLSGDNETLVIGMDAVADPAGIRIGSDEQKKVMK